LLHRRPGVQRRELGECFQRFAFEVWVRGECAGLWGELYRWAAVRLVGGVDMGSFGRVVVSDRIGMILS
jgi:hypothetical protein